jgi:hypothetical protein
VRKEKVFLHTTFDANLRENTITALSGGLTIHDNAVPHFSKRNRSGRESKIAGTESYSCATTLLRGLS